MELTISQQEALLSFDTFLDSPARAFILKGAAGTGKTTLVREMLTLLGQRRRPAVLMAPTGRAAYIIGQKTGHDSATIHSSIYGLSQLKPGGERGADDDSSLFARYALKANRDTPDTVYIVDESSMVSDTFTPNEAFSFGSGRLLYDLFQYIGSRKVIFVGDYAQLPPVGMDFSPALSASYLRDTFDCPSSEVTLREVLRQDADSEILRSATRIRDSIEQHVFVEFKVATGPDSIAENDSLLRPYFELYPNSPGARAAVITYTNRRALQYNIDIRRHYLGEDAPRLCPGDLLLIARNNYAFQEELFNGNVVRVETCDSDNDLIKRTVGIKIGGDVVEHITLSFRKAAIRFMAHGEPVELTVYVLDNFLDDPTGAPGSTLSRALVVDFENRLPENIRSRINEIKRALYVKQRSSSMNELCEEYLRRLSTDEFYNAVICKYGYAMTCHKAQGGEWDNVFVDMTRNGGTDNEDYFRWAYTAITRAGRRLWHYRSPDFNYLSRLVVGPVQSAPKLAVSMHTDGGDFRDERFDRLAAIAARNGLSVTEDRSKQFQHRITFMDDASGQAATITLWYKAKGYNGKDVIQGSPAPDFTARCRAAVDASLAPPQVPFNAPDRPLACRMAAYIASVCDSLGIAILDITAEQYQDVFHLRADGLARVSIYYTDKGNYTHMTLQSTLGADDLLLESFRQKFIQ